MAGELVRLACQRHVDDLERYKEGKVYRWDWSEASRAIRFIQCLEHYEGQFHGQKFLLQPFQKFIVGSLFGWRRIDNTRRYRRAYVSFGRGNGKTPLASAILLYTSVSDSPREPYADCRIGAVDGQQAQDIKDSLSAFVQQIPELRALLTETKRSMLWKHNGSSIKLFSSNPKSVDGKRLHCVVLDELHEWSGKNAEVLDKIETAMGKRSNPLTIYITTAGTERSAIWKRIDHQSSQVLRGTFEDPTRFVYLARLDEADDTPEGLLDPQNWVKANPNLGVSCTVSYIEEAANLARQDAFEMQKFRRYHLNMMARSLDKLIEPQVWAACEGPLPSVKGLPSWGGLDMGWRDDLMSLYWVTPVGLGEAKRYVIHGKCWVPEDGPRPLSAEPWLGWIKAGHLVVTSGDTTDPESVRAEILRQQKHLQVRSLAYDGSQDRVLGTELLNQHGVPMFEFYQSCGKYNEPFRKLLAMLRERKILVRCPILKWAADNVVVKMDAAGRIMPNKQKSPEKIDPFVASLMALGECLFAEANPGPYAAHGLLVSQDGPP